MTWPLHVKEREKRSVFYHICTIPFSRVSILTDTHTQTHTQTQTQTHRHRHTDTDTDTDTDTQTHTQPAEVVGWDLGGSVGCLYEVHQVNQWATVLHR